MTILYNPLMKGGILKMSDVAKRVDNAGQIVASLIAIGFLVVLGVVFYGNLSGNLGFADSTNISINESGHFINATTYTLDRVSDGNWVSATLTSVVNASNGVVITAGNFTFNGNAGTIVGTAGRTENYTVNITYTSVIRTVNGLNADNVVGNQTSGLLTFSNTTTNLYSIVSVILIIVLISILFVVGMDAMRRRKSGDGFK